MGRRKQPDGHLTDKQRWRRFYDSVHQWLWYHFDKDKTCEHCGTKEAKRFDYALKKGCSYEKKRENYLILCRKCHFIYDEVDLVKISSLRDEGCFKRIHEAKKKSIAQLSTDGNHIKSYKSITDAWQETGVLRSSISNNLYGRSKMAGGFVWVLNDNKKLKVCAG